MAKPALHLLGCAALLTVSCGTTVRSTALNPPPRTLSPRPAESVRIYTSGRPVGPHVDVALLEAEQDSGMSIDETDAILAALRRRAGQLGCDALVVGGTSSRASPVERVLFDLNADRKGLFGTCVVYRVESGDSGSEEPPPGLSSQRRGRSLGARPGHR